MLRALQQATLVGVVGAILACGNSKTDQAGRTGVGGIGSPGGAGGAGGSGGAQGAAGTASGSAGSAGASGAGPSGGSAGQESSEVDAGAGRGGAPDAGQGGDAGSSDGGAASEGGCAGTFGEERVILAAGEDIVFSSPTLPGDELELFFVKRDDSVGSRHVFRAERATKDEDFGDPSPVAVFDQVCDKDDDWSLAITPDGLRLYVGCYTGSGTGTPGPLSLARRPDRNARFVLDAMTYGTVGSGVSVTPDELTALSSAEFDNAGRAPPVEYARSSLDQAFGTSRTINGLEEVFITAPFLAPDGETLFGAMRPDLVMTSRSNPDAPFSKPIVLFKGDNSTLAYGSPELSADCRTLYFARSDIIDGSPVGSIRAASR